MGSYVCWPEDGAASLTPGGSSRGHRTDWRTLTGRNPSRSWSPHRGIETLPSSLQVHNNTAFITQKYTHYTNIFTHPLPSHLSAIPSPSHDFFGKHPFLVSLPPPTFSKIISTHSSPSLHPPVHPFSSSFFLLRSSFSFLRRSFSSSFSCSRHALDWSPSSPLPPPFSTGGRPSGEMTGPGVSRYGLRLGGGLGLGLGSGLVLGGGVSSPKPQRSCAGG